MQKTIVRLFGLVVALLLGGCATFEYTKPAPAQTQPISVKMSGEELSGLTDVPVGSYRVPNSQVIITGHQKSPAGGMMFGLLGVAAAHASGGSTGADTVKDIE